MKKFLLFEVMPYAALLILWLIIDVVRIPDSMVFAFYAPIIVTVPAVAGYIANYRKWRYEKWTWLVWLYPVFIPVLTGFARLVLTVNASGSPALTSLFIWTAILFPCTIVYALAALGCVIYCEFISKKKHE